MAWRLPSIIQGIPAILLAGGIWFMPFSPRWLVKKGRYEEARKTLAWIRKKELDDPLVEVELLEIRAQQLFEERAFARALPQYANKENRNPWVHEIVAYVQCFKTWDNVKRVATAWLVMFFQQWSGIDAIIYYATNVFMSFGFTEGTIALLATGVTGVVFLVSTIPAMVSRMEYRKKDSCFKKGHGNDADSKPFSLFSCSSTSSAASPCSTLAPSSCS